MTEIRLKHLCNYLRLFLRRLGKEKQTCRYRMNDFGPWEHGENLDYWFVMRDGTRTCSFCGSLHPEDFEKLLDRAIEKGDVDVDPSTNGGKWYVYRPEVKNAGEGGIKFKVGHRGDKEWAERVEPKIQQACRESIERLQNKARIIAQERREP